MKWFDKWFYNKCKQSWENSKNYQEQEMRLTGAMPIPNSVSVEAQGMNFSVYKANGGHIVEYREYDRKTDRSNNKLHIITDDKDLGEELGKIITFESLRS